MMAEVALQSEEPPTSPTADELKSSLGTCSADAGTQRSRVAVYFRLVTVNLKYKAAYQQPWVSAKYNVRKLLSVCNRTAF